MAQPGNVTCTTSGPLGAPTNLTIGTTVTDPRYTYWVRMYDTGGVAKTPYRQMTGSGSVRQYTYALLSGDLPLLTINTTYHARVYARVGSTTWESGTYRTQPVSKTTVLVNCGTAPQTPQITFRQPTNGATYVNDEILDVVGPACDHDYGSTYAAACGNVTDDGSVTSVDYIFQRNGGTLGTRCWTGTIWWFNCDYQPANRAGTGWSIPKGVTNIAYQYDGTYSIKIRATDNQGNVSVKTITFTVVY